MSGTKYHPSTPCGYQDFCCPGFLCIMTLVPGGERGVLLKSKYSYNSICDKILGFDITVINRFNLIWDCLRGGTIGLLGTFYYTTESLNDVVFTREYEFILCISPVNVWWDQLECGRCHTVYVNKTINKSISYSLEFSLRTID